MKRAIAAILTCLLGLGLVVTTPMAAEARKKKRDTPGCVTSAEYRAVRDGMTGAQVAAIFDTWGSSRFVNDHGYWEGDYEDSGYYESTWVDDGSYYDESWNWIEVGYFEDVWTPDLYWNEHANWEPVIDAVRSYKKCRSFNRGRGKVAINFDNYSHSYPDVRVAYTHPSNPAFMDIAASFRKGARVPGKVVPQPRTKAETPKPKSIPGPQPQAATRG